MEKTVKTADTAKKEMKGSTERTRDRKTFVPRVDIYEDENGLVMLADVPGADESSVNITLDNDILTIEASVEDNGVSGHNLIHSEYGVGDFYRSFTLSEHIDRDRIEARMKNGVLKVMLPREQAQKARRISISSGE